MSLPTMVHGWPLSGFQNFTFNPHYLCTTKDAGLPVWRYRYFGVFPNLHPFNWLGAWHSAIQRTLFNTADKNGVANTPEQDEAVSFLQSILVSFAKDPVHGLTKLGFPQYDPEGRSLVQLMKGTTLMSVNASTGYDAAC
ncbi:uncharacterized protein BDV17DRAFT_291468 [Aspergillus undulatus]|uniref:uncharacterized protein n=1 Tax=Aspergillus undulatus TaxID=1810928 RepID=UPI003CCCBB6C